MTGSTERLRVLTWNLNGLDSSRLDSRMEKACAEIVLGMSVREAMEGRTPPPLPHVLCFQEVVRRVHIAKLRPHLTAAGFAVFPEEPPEREDFLVAAVRPPWRIRHARYVPFEVSRLQRGYLELDLVHEDGSEVRALCAHMESLRSGAEERIAQTLELHARLTAGGQAVFAGDTNLRVAEWKTALADASEYGTDMGQDAFDLAGRPKAHAGTWWPEESNQGFRFDRVWLGGKGWRVTDMRTRRRDKLSDHAAVEVALDW